MEQHNDRNQWDASRWGGAALTLGSLTYAIAVVAYVIFYGQPHGSGPGGELTVADRVAHLQGRWQLAQSLWFVEMLAALLIAVAGFVLQHRTASSQTRLPPSIAWVTVGVGALLLSLMYPVMLGGYPSALRSFHEEPALFALINGIATFIFNVGNAVLFIGLAGAFAAEVRPAGVLSRGIAFTGAALCVFSSVVAFGMLLGIVAMAAAALLGLAAFGLTAFLGFAIWRAPADKSRRA